MPRFSSRFKQALERKGISRRELARLSGVHVNTLNNWAMGEVPNPHPRQLQKVADVLGVAYEWLRLGEGPMPHSGVAENVPSRGVYRDESLFDAALMEQVIHLTEDYLRLFRKNLVKEKKIEMMEHAYRKCVEAGLSGAREISMSEFKDLLKSI